MSTTQLSTATADARNEFLDNLRQMATGSYLRDEDREFWEAPYPESAVDEAQQIVDGMLQAAQTVAAGDEAELKELSARHEDALLEDEEIKDLLALVEKLAVDLDADEIFVENQAEAVCEA